MTPTEPTRLARAAVADGHRGGAGGAMTRGHGEGMAHTEIRVAVNAWVDAGVASLVSALNEHPHVTTLDSCQEDEKGEAYVFFTSHGAELFDAARDVALALRGADDLGSVVSLEWWYGAEAPAARLRCPAADASLVAERLSAARRRAKSNIASEDGTENAQMRLKRADGETYLERWGWECDLFGVYVHRMDAPDPGLDLHDHPWWFASLVLRGGYDEIRADVRGAPTLAVYAEQWPDTCQRGAEVHRRWLSLRTMRLDECHTITAIDRCPTWTLVLRGRRRRPWGFYLPSGWTHWRTYDASHRRGDLYATDGAGRPLGDEVES